MATTAEQQIIDRYNRLVELHTDPDACFICGKRRVLMTALVQGPGVGKPVAGRGHGVCRPCIKAGEATALR